MNMTCPWKVKDLDVRGMHPPEPMERVLEALDVLQPGERLRMLIDREPRPLFRILFNNGYQYSTLLRPDFLYEIMIWKQVPQESTAALA